MISVSVISICFLFLQINTENMIDLSLQNIKYLQCLLKGAMETEMYYTLVLVCVCPLLTKNQTSTAVSAIIPKIQICMYVHIISSLYNSIWNLGEGSSSTVGNNSNAGVLEEEPIPTISWPPETFDATSGDEDSLTGLTNNRYEPNEVIFGKFFDSTICIYSHTYI